MEEKRKPKKPVVVFKGNHGSGEANKENNDCFADGEVTGSSVPIPSR